MAYRAASKGFDELHRSHLRVKLNRPMALTHGPKNHRNQKKHAQYFQEEAGSVS